MDALQLRQMAQDRRLGPEDSIRKGDSGNWLPADRARGLFDARRKPVAVQELPIQRPEPVQEAAQSDPPKLHPCPDCDKLVSKRAEQCSHCGCRLAAPARRDQRSRIAALMLAWFFGLTGAHKFYLGERGARTAYLLCSCTVLLAPVIALLAIVDGFRILSAADEEFEVVTPPRRITANDSKSQWLSNTLGWMFGVVLVMASLGLVLNGRFVSGLLMCIAGAVLIPPVLPRLFAGVNRGEQYAAVAKSSSVLLLMAAVAISEEPSRNRPRQPAGPSGTVDRVGGFTESQRLKLFHEFVLIEDLYPGNTSAQLPHKQRLYDRYGIDEEFELQLLGEAIEKRWPLPPQAG